MKTLLITIFAGVTLGFLSSFIVSLVNKSCTSNSGVDLIKAVNDGGLAFDK